MKIFYVDDVIWRHVRFKMAAKRKSKMEERLKTSLEEGDYYNALQTIKVLYSRYNLQGKSNECISLLYNGATELLKKDKVNQIKSRLSTLYKINNVLLCTLYKINNVLLSTLYKINNVLYI